MVTIQYDDTKDRLITDLERSYRPRMRLGLSQIGDPCARKLWLIHNGVTGKRPSGRVLMLFALGEMVEDYLAKLLNVVRRQEQVNYRGRLYGHIDGVIRPIEAIETEHLWECKTASKSNFAKIQKHGYEAYNPAYKAQIHVYAYLLGLARIFVTVYCKDNSELYTERIKTNRDCAELAMERAWDITEAKVPPPIQCPDRDFFQARLCDYSEYCFEDCSTRANTIF